MPDLVKQLKAGWIVKASWLADSSKFKSTAAKKIKGKSAVASVRYDMELFQWHSVKTILRPKSVTVAGKCSHDVKVSVHHTRKVLHETSHPHRSVPFKV